jgi:hypothetical protein
MMLLKLQGKTNDTNNGHSCVISGVLRDVDEIFAPLGYAACSGHSLSLYALHGV